MLPETTLAATPVILNQVEPKEMKLILLKPWLALKTKVKFKQRFLKQPLKFPESKLAHRYLDGLRGIEIGGAKHNAFGLRTINVDWTDDHDLLFEKFGLGDRNDVLRIDLIAKGDDLPFKDETVDFVLNSHVIEHFYDPIKTIGEWMRVIKKGGYLFMIVPHRERTFDEERPRTTLQELIDRHERPNPPAVDSSYHHSVWVTEDFLELCAYLGLTVLEYQDVDDKVGNGFTVVIRKD